MREEFRSNLEQGRTFGSVLAPPYAVVWVAGAFLVLRTVACFYYDPVTFDSAVYFEIAGLMQHGRWIEALAHDYPPLFALLIAVLQPLVGSVALAGVLVAAVADLLALFPLVAIARRVAGEEAAWAAAFLWVVHPSAIRLGVQALSDAPTMLCVLLAVYAGYRALEERRLSLAAAAGMASGLAFLFRPEGLEPVVGLAALYAAYSIPRLAAKGGSAVEDCETSVRRAQPALRRGVWIVAPLVGWVLVAGPYVAHISKEAGSLTLSKKKSAAGFVESVVPIGSDAPRPFPVTPETRQDGVTASSSTLWLTRIARNAYIFQKPLVNGLSPLVIILGCIGLWAMGTGRTTRWSAIHALLLGLLVLHFGILVGLASDRGVDYVARHHVLLMVAYALPISGAGMAWIIGRVEVGPARRWVAAALLGVVVIGTTATIVFRGPDQGRSLRSAAAWIRLQVSGTPVIVTSLAKLTYHAQAKRVDLRGTYDTIIGLAREQSADYIAFYPDLVPQTAPDFLARRSSADLELVKVFPEPTRSAPDQRLELYRLRPKDDRHSGATSVRAKAPVDKQGQ